MTTVTKEKLNYWCSEEYNKRMDAIGALGKAIDKIMDDYDLLGPVIESLTAKLSPYDSDVLVLSGIQDDLLDHIGALNDRSYNMLKTIE